MLKYGFTFESFYVHLLRVLFQACEWAVYKSVVPVLISAHIHFVLKLLNHSVTTCRHIAFKITYLYSRYW